MPRNWLLRERAIANSAATLFALVLATVLAASASHADPLEPARPAQAAPPPARDIWQEGNLTGTWGGLRDRLKDRGLEFTIIGTGEIFGVLSGGIEQGPTYEGLLEFTTDADLEKLLGWTGATAHVTVFGITDPGDTNALALTGSLSDPSNIDALPTVRLYQAYLEQFIVPGRLSIRAGQIAADGDFKVKPRAEGLLNGTFGWPTAESSNLPSGGPAYPLAAGSCRGLSRQPV